jgi:hypothetical protein
MFGSGCVQRCSSGPRIETSNAAYKDLERKALERLDQQE